MTEEEVFTQDDYNELVGSLDAAMAIVKDKFGKTEKEARDWLESFVCCHYFQVWREIKS